MKKIFTTLAVMAACYAVNAQTINYHDVDPDTTVTQWDAFNALGLDIWWHPTPEVVVNSWDREVLCSVDSLPLAMVAGDTISATAGLWTTVSYKCLNCGGTTGNWQGVEDGYLGIRSKDGSGNWRYGWIRMDIMSASGFTVKDYALHQSANISILAGQAFPTGIGTHREQEHITMHGYGREVMFRGIKTVSQLSVIDISGQTLEKRNISDNEKIDLSAYPPALYILHLQSEGAFQSFKLIIK